MISYVGIQLWPWKVQNLHIFIISRSIVPCHEFVPERSWQYLQETSNSKHSNSIFKRHCGWLFTPRKIVWNVPDPTWVCSVSWAWAWHSLLTQLRTPRNFYYHPTNTKWPVFWCIFLEGGHEVFNISIKEIDSTRVDVSTHWPAVPFG